MVGPLGLPVANRRVQAQSPVGLDRRCVGRSRQPIVLAVETGQPMGGHRQRVVVPAWQARCVGLLLHEVGGGHGEGTLGTRAEANGVYRGRN